ncbi:hypothetical protein [Dokdonella sp.]|uniref:hypothetical protein n=1 Tax=Dokdonella sp. TaxID=2291710 RepID=UPI003C684DDD
MNLAAPGLVAVQVLLARLSVDPRETRHLTDETGVTIGSRQAAVVGIRFVEVM